jgi:hypothetical protein
MKMFSSDFLLSSKIKLSDYALRLTDRNFAGPLPPPPLQPGGRHLGGSGCGLSATTVPMLSVFEAASSRPISALAATVAAASAVNASAQAPASLFVVAMVISYSVSASGVLIHLTRETVPMRRLTTENGSFMSRICRGTMTGDLTVAAVTSVRLHRRERETVFAMIIVFYAIRY